MTQMPHLTCADASPVWSVSQQRCKWGVQSASVPILDGCLVLYIPVTCPDETNQRYPVTEWDHIILNTLPCKALQGCSTALVCFTDLLSAAQYHYFKNGAVSGEVMVAHVPMAWNLKDDGVIWHSASRGDSVWPFWAMLRDEGERGPVLEHHMLNLLRARSERVTYMQAQLIAEPLGPTISVEEAVRRAKDTDNLFKRMSLKRKIYDLQGQLEYMESTSTRASDAGSGPDHSASAANSAGTVSTTTPGQNSP